RRGLGRDHAARSWVSCSATAVPERHDHGEQPSGSSSVAVERASYCECPVTIGTERVPGIDWLCQVVAWQPRCVSWDEAFAVGYEEWSAHMTEDVVFYVGLAREADGPVVELAVGNGRVAIPVARATGQRVVG